MTSESERDTDLESPGVDQGGSERADGRLLELLVCPLTKSRLEYDPVRHELVSAKARLAFPIRRGVPHMVPSEARNLDE
jgi:uncharacterized protein